MLELNLKLKWNYKGKIGDETIFHQALHDMSDQLGDWSPAFTLIAEDVLAPFVAQQFTTEGEESETPWPGLADSTIAERHSAHPILVRSGNMLRSFREGDTEHEETITRKTMRWGSRVPYSLFHQTGTRAQYRGPGGLPKTKSAPRWDAVGLPEAEETRRKYPKARGSGMPARPILVITEAMGWRMRQVMIGRLGQIARQTGFGRYGSDAGGPGQARLMGQRMLGLTE